MQHRNGWQDYRDGRRHVGTTGALLTFDPSGEAFDLIVEQLGSWLREKNLDVEARESAHVADPERHLQLRFTTRRPQADRCG